MGKLYLYYPTKEDIFIDLVQHMEQKMEALRRTKIFPLMQSPDPESLKQLGMAVGRVVSENLDYWRLMYVNVVEFRHKDAAAISTIETMDSPLADTSSVANKWLALLPAALRPRQIVSSDNHVNNDNRSDDSGDSLIISQARLLRLGLELSEFLNDRGYQRTYYVSYSTTSNAIQTSAHQH